MVAIRIPKEIEENIEKIKAAFAERWPSHKYPTLSASLQLCIHRSIRQFILDPDQLQVEVRDFTARYAQKTK